MVTPLGCGAETFWSAALSGRSAVRRITGFPCEDLPSRIAGEVSEFHADEWVDESLARRLDRFGAFAAGAVEMALDDARVREDEDRSRWGFLLGSAVAGLEFAVDQHERYLAHGREALNPYLGLLDFGGSCVHQIGAHLGFRGPSLLMTSTMDAGTRAIGEAYRRIAFRQADLAVAGGADATVFPLALAALGLTGILSERNDEPELACRPYDRRRDGMVLGEGACILVLESGDHLHRRRGAPYARICGYGAAQAPEGLVSPHPEGSEMRAALHGALGEAGWAASDCDYVALQGSSTPQGDRAEAAALRALLGDALGSVPGSAVQSMTGHLQGASGALGAAVACLAIRDGVLPPTVNHVDTDPACLLDCVAGEHRHRRVRRALAHAYGLTGTASALAFESVGDGGLPRRERPA